MNEKTNAFYLSLSATFNEKFPFISVIIPVEVPLIITVAPGIAAPV